MFSFTFKYLSFNATTSVPDITDDRRGSGCGDDHNATMLTDDWILSNCGTIVHWQTGFCGLYIANIASQLACPPLPCQAMTGVRTGQPSQLITNQSNSI